MNIFSNEFYNFMEQFGNAMTMGITNTADFYDDLDDDYNDAYDIDDDEDEINNKRLVQYDNIHTESRILFKLKNKDYGDSFADYGPIGVLMRMKDKLNRLQNITKGSVTLINVETLMEDENLRDTLIDLHNYSAMALMLLDE